MARPTSMSNPNRAQLCQQNPRSVPGVDACPYQDSRIEKKSLSRRQMCARGAVLLLLLAALVAMSHGRSAVAGVMPVLALGSGGQHAAAAGWARESLLKLRGGAAAVTSNPPQKSVPVYLMMPLDTLNVTTRKLSDNIPELLQGAVEMGAVSLSLPLLPFIARSLPPSHAQRLRPPSPFSSLRPDSQPRACISTLLRRTNRKE